MVSRVTSDYYLELKGSILLGDLCEITTKDKKRMIGMIKKRISDEFFLPNSDKWKELRNEKDFDVAIAIHVNKQRYKRQDLDNVAKIILDAIKKHKSDGPDEYLINDDSQVVRLLLYKKQRDELKDVETDQLSISIRKHNPGEEMILNRFGGLMSEEDYKEYLARNPPYLRPNHLEMS